MQRHVMNLRVCVLSLCLVAPVWSISLPVENASFESPAIDLAQNPFGAWPMIDGWIETDLDVLGSQNTGVFVNSPVDVNSHIVNADGAQLAFLGSQTGNGLSQDLTSVYQAGASYRLTVGVAVSQMFPPSIVDPIDTLELALYYMDANVPVDIVTTVVSATGLSSTELIDFSVELPWVGADANYVGQPIGIAMRSVGEPNGFWDLDNVRVTECWPVSIPVENSSFESPAIDLAQNPFGAFPMIAGWIETDLDQLGSQNTGVFVNSPVDVNSHIVNADGAQLAFLGSAVGNGLSQDLSSVYQAGASYRLTVGVAVSQMFPPSMVEPADTLELALYYVDGNEPVDIARTVVEATGLSSTELRDFSVEVSSVDANCVGYEIGVAIRSTGQEGGFWDLDNVRLTECWPVSLPVENGSFESPAIDLAQNPFGAFPLIDGWIETDLDQLGSQNTGVFVNSPADSNDHIVNADGAQLAFLGSAVGNGLSQELTSVYQAGASYRLTVGVAVSQMFPPSMVEPVDTLELALYYVDGNEPVDIASTVVEATGLSSTELVDVSVELPWVGADANWVGQPIGVAIRSTGQEGGFWDLDNVRLVGTSM